MCEECGKPNPLRFKSGDGTLQNICRQCRSHHLDIKEWYLQDTCRICAYGEKYCTCESYTN